MKRKATKRQPYVVDKETAEALLWLLGGTWNGRSMTSPELSPVNTQEVER